MLTRRDVLGGARVGLLCACGNGGTAAQIGAEPRRPRLEGALAAIERRSGGRLGVTVLDSGNRGHVSWRGDERFPMASTFKLLLAAAVLARADRGEERLSRRLPVPASGILSTSPYSERHAGGSAPIGELCEAVVTLSDNTGANLLLDTVGGPAGFTSYLRALGDPVTRLDRYELEMSQALPGDSRDTITPAAMAANLHRLLLADALSAQSRRSLTDWMIATRTGMRRLRAGLPADWRAGDKTGTAPHGTANDLAILWPPHRAPLLVAAFLTGSPSNLEGRNAVLAQVGRAIATSHG